MPTLNGKFQTFFRSDRTSSSGSVCLSVCLSYHKREQYHYNTTALQTAAQQHFRTIRLQLSSTEAQQHCSIVALQHNSTVALQHSSTATLQHSSIAAQQHCRKIGLQKGKKGNLQHQGIRKLKKFSTTSQRHILSGPSRFLDLVLFLLGHSDLLF